jgi:hypothetical protein
MRLEHRSLMLQGNAETPKDRSLIHAPGVLVVQGKSFLPKTGLLDKRALPFKNSLIHVLYFCSML